MNEQNVDKAAELLKIIAHPVRLRIMLALVDQPLTVSTLLKQFPIDQPLMSHHLIKMKYCGLLASQRQGKAIYYSLADHSLLEAIVPLFK